MITYYIEKDDKIIFASTDLQTIQNTVKFSGYAEADIQETERPIVKVHGGYEFADTSEYQAEFARQEQERINQEAEQFLNDTDWMVIRHRDQLALGIPTSLTEEEFRQLLLDRQAARDQVIRQ